MSALVAVVLLGGCASIPTDSPVYPGEGQDDGGAQGDPYVRLIPVPPRPGAGETDLVRDFLSSMGSFEDDHGAARAYLTPEREAEWDPDGTALVYDERGTVDIELVDGASDPAGDDEAAASAQVRMEATRTATINADGRFVPAGDDDLLEVTFRLRQVDGEWRIDELPENLILSGQAVDRVYRSLNLYFLNPEESMVVPDTVLLPGHVTSNLADQLARRLVQGPTSWLEPAVYTAFPEDTTADTAYQAGTLTVDLSPAAAMTSEDERFGMAAQLAWTFRQVPEVQELRLRIAGEDMQIPGADGVTVDVTSGLWDSVDPSGGPGEDAPGHVYVTRDGALLAMDEDQAEHPVPGAAGSGTGIDRHAVSITEDRVAGIDPEAQEVRVAPMVSDGEYGTVLAGSDFRALSWDGAGDLWVAARQEQSVDEPDETEPDVGGVPGSELWLLNDGTDPIEVDVPELDGRIGTATVEQLRVARDGVRAAVVLGTEEGSQLAVGRLVERADGLEFGELVPVATEFEEVTDVSWRGPDQLALLGQHEDSTPQAYLSPSGGGGQATSAGAAPGVEMETITAMPNRPLLAGADDNEIWLTDDRLTWLPAGEGSAPTYPG
ncbi:LpqB family beta-propeller domain-containing protein [Lipingzhangella sp. LS1_29]|uniref:LpqB family beta-propeller domain-containing protein n=1 Tax=Lipingzhangella rawalii TaxID=2055835 RepID=A0ABU2H6E1_9ACTN|nr:LpqB family beta-propeller domain-containing protein [Lipingzhangella rawalii]MDS1270420.1 LpqB family beta-propeller domain-containing protein [Lipingzhangella rawalii]